jgi:adenine-specific DNA-methyltransferase
LNREGGKRHGKGTVGFSDAALEMNTDLLTEDLKKARSSSRSVWLMRQPDH